MGIEYPKITLPSEGVITVNLVNGLGGSGEIVAVRYDDDGGLMELVIKDQDDREDTLHLRGDLLAAWRLGPTIPPEQVAQAQQRPGHILIPMDLPPDGRLRGR